MPAEQASEAEYFRQLASSCRKLLDIFGQEEHTPQEKQQSELGVSEYRRELESKLQLFDSKLQGLIGERSREQ